MAIHAAYRLCVQELQRRVPALFAARRVLYVGANRSARPTLADELLAAGVELHLLEIWGPNVEHYQERETEIFASVTQGDVREIAGMHLGQFDAIVWWHGPEHLEADEWPAALVGLEALAPLVVVGCPGGGWEWGRGMDNPFETHRAHLYPADLEAAGYTVQTTGKGPDRQELLIAWKGETGMRGDEWYYAKAGDSPTFWLVRGGQRERIGNPAEVYRHGMLEIRLMSRDELAAIPIKEE